jgi:kynurenine formamidase
VLIDLSHPIATGMPVWPGDPVVRLRPAAELATAGYNLLAVELGSQTGTHVDAPYHVADDLPRLHEIPLDRFVGPAVVADLREVPAAAPIEPINLEPIRPRLAPGVVLLLCTGWSRHWGRAEYAEHPWLGPSAARLVVDAGVRTVGIDAPSVDASSPPPPGADPLPTHRLLAARHVVIAENLTNLEALLEPSVGAVQVWLMPLGLQDADGAPVRAVAQAQADCRPWT